MGRSGAWQEKPGTQLAVLERERNPRPVECQDKGEIKQTPSMFSALKHKGTPLYRYARKGVEIEREARSILINGLTLDGFDGKRFSLTVSCSKGTYIRALARDIGEALQSGAHLTGLIRTRVGEVTLEHCLDPECFVEWLEQQSIDEENKND